MLLLKCSVSVALWFFLCQGADFMTVISIVILEQTEQDIVNHFLCFRCLEMCCKSALYKLEPVASDSTSPRFW